MKKYLTFNDLKNMEYCVNQQLRICNQPEESKKLWRDLRCRIAEVMEEVKVKVVKND